MFKGYSAIALKNLYTAPELLVLFADAGECGEVQKAAGLQQTYLMCFCAGRLMHIKSTVIHCCMDPGLNISVENKFTV